MPAMPFSGPTPSLADELEIKWLEDVSTLPYARERLFTTATKQRKPAWCGPGRLVGYAVLKEDARRPGYSFIRRMFYLMPFDHADRYPCERVDPKEITPGVYGSAGYRWDVAKAASAALVQSPA